MLDQSRNGTRARMPQTRHISRRNLCVLALAATAGTALPQSPRAAAIPDCPRRDVDLPMALSALRAAYPDFIATADTTAILWKDGTRMPVTQFPQGRSVDEQIRNPDLADQLRQAYPKGPCGIPLDPSSDAGRIRYTPFFTRMYGADPAAVARNLVNVPWPARRRGTSVAFTQVNGAADALAKVASELANLPARFHRFFDNPAGGFYWRNIAGTNRLSGHAFGIAIDINVNMSDYWRNELHRVTDEPANWRSSRPRNRIPFDIVDIFERRGFIWGGKWYHYDTMHFEYRPELLL